MKQISKYFFSLMVGAVLAATVGVGATQAATIASGSVIKGSSTALYYLAADGKRYVFPNDKAYFSWYPDFSEVQKVSDTVLSSYPLGGNVTYRPGTQLVKIQSDPKVYAVDEGGVLRWVDSESAAIAIFGSNWNKHVDDIADAFFINYTVGNPIASAGDYNPSSLAAADANFNSDRSYRSGQANSATNTNTNTNTNTTVNAGNGTVAIALSPYSATLGSGQSTTVTATGNDNNGITSISIYAGSNGTLEKTCNISGSAASGTCTMSIYSNDYTNGSSLSIYAQMTDRSGNTATSATTTLAVQNNVTSITGSVALALSPYSSTLASGQSTTVTATAYDAGGISSMGIYVNGALAQTCPVSNYPTSNSCVTTVYGGSYANGSSVSIYAQITDNYGNTAVSTTSALTIQNSSSNTGTVTLSLSPYATTLASGQSTTVTATASNGNGLASMGIYVNGSLLQTCPVSGYPTAGSCAVTLYGSSYSAGQSVSVYAQSTDRYGNISVSPTSTITVQNTTGNGSGYVFVSLSPYATTLANNQSTTVTATANNANGIASVGIYANGSLIQTCPVSGYPTASSCTAAIYGSGYSNNQTISVYAQSTDRYGNVSNSTTSTLTAQSVTTANAGTVTLSLSPYSSTLASGQTTTANASGYNGSGMSSMSVYVNGSLAQSCPFSAFTASANCSVSISGNNYGNGATVSVYAQMTDTYGNAVTSTTSTLTVQNTGTTTGSTGSVSLSFSPYATTVPFNQSTTVTANANDTDGIASIAFYVNGAQTGSVCSLSNNPTSGACAISLYGGNYQNGSTVTVYAQATDRYGSVTTSTTSYLVI
jgi:hypothetical protein